jgi:hypothetical protein
VSNVRFTLPKLRQDHKHWTTSDVLTRDHVSKYLERQKTATLDSFNRLPGQMFWPPRVVKAVQDDCLTLFFGSGLSIPAGIPDWMGLLRGVGLDPDVERDPNANGDLLTLAELAAHAVGADLLQTTIRQALNANTPEPTVAHYLLAALCLPVCLTTNYDCLFEKAFERIYGNRPQVITNDLDVHTILGGDLSLWEETLKNRKECILIKLHGCLERKGEHLILTRSDYRQHYRSNTKMLKLIEDVLGTRHTLFLGFSHRDPEVSRIIENVIYNAERTDKPIPGFYSLQFDMQQKTPEIFAAKGIVALQPTLILSHGNANEARAFSLAQGVTDLFSNVKDKVDKSLSLDRDLGKVAKTIAKVFRKPLDKLDKEAQTAGDALNAKDKAKSQEVTDRLVRLDCLGEFANQGVYLADQNGEVVAASCPQGLETARRLEDFGPEGVLERPYFRLAQSNRKPFISDLFESVFNENATLAACHPLHDNGKFLGLLFSAFQPREDGFVKEIRDSDIPEDASLLVTDANGMLVIPPEKEISQRRPSKVKIVSEDLDANVGYSFWELLKISRRDKRIDRLIQNIVPLSQDDDICQLSSDVTTYSVVTQVSFARWKVALSRFLRIARVIPNDAPK